MATDNVDIWKKLIFRIPPYWKMVAGNISGGMVFSLLIYFGMNRFGGYAMSQTELALVAAFVFVVPALVSAELLRLVIDHYPDNWAHFLTFCNQLILFVYGLILVGAVGIEATLSVFWLSIISIFLLEFIVLTLTMGYSYLKEAVVLSNIQPGLILLAFHYRLGPALGVGMEAYAINGLRALIAGAAVLGLFFLMEYLISANVSNISVLRLTSGLFHKRQAELEIGHPTRPDVQTLKLENEDSEAIVAVPWIHPGPLERFGGGQITSDIIDSLNDREQGFFFHVPSTHRADPVNPEDYKKILEALGTPETSSKASRLVKKDYGEAKFYGRKVNGKNIVYLDTSTSDNNFDDYEVSIFREVIDPEETMVIDLHNKKRKLTGERQGIWYNTETSTMLREYLKDFLEVMEDVEEQEGYRCGFHSFDGEEDKIFALAEEVDGQRTLTFGIEGNEKGKELAELEDEYSDEFDEVVVFTTDTHRSLHQLASENQVDRDKVVETVEKASETVSPGRLGFSSREADKMDLLQEDYSGLIFSINILIRLMPLALIFMYLGLVVWIW